MTRTCRLAAAMLQARPFGSALHAPAPRSRSGIGGLPAPLAARDPSIRSLMALAMVAY